MGKGGAPRQQAPDQNLGGGDGRAARGDAQAAAGAHALVRRQAPRGEDRDHQPGPQDARGGHGGAGHAGGEARRRQVPHEQGIQGQAAEAGANPQEGQTRPDEAARHPHDVRPRHAGAPRARARPGGRGAGGQGLVRVQERQARTGRAPEAVHIAGKEGLARMGAGRRHQGLLRQHIPRMAHGERAHGQGRDGPVPEGRVHGAGRAARDRGRHAPGRHHQPDLPRPRPRRDGEAARRSPRPGRHGREGLEKGRQEQGPPCKVCRRLRGHRRESPGGRGGEGSARPLPRGAGACAVGGEDAGHKHRRRIRLPGLELPQVQREAHHQAVEEVRGHLPRGDPQGNPRRRKGHVAGRPHKAAVAEGEGVRQLPQARMQLEGVLENRPRDVHAAQALDAQEASHQGASVDIPAVLVLARGGQLRLRHAGAVPRPHDLAAHRSAHATQDRHEPISGQGVLREEGRDTQKVRLWVLPQTSLTSVRPRA